MTSSGRSSCRSTRRSSSSTTSITAQGSFTEAEEVDEGHPATTAFAAMNALVDQRCLGLA
jgi:hypothetical protein